MSNVIHISNYEPKAEDSFFLDTNIWMHLYCSVGSYREESVNAYNNFFQKVLEAGSKIYTTSMQLSEFFNAYCKVEYHIAKREVRGPFDYKRDFRPSEDFEHLIELIKYIVDQKILKNSIKLNDDFDTINIDRLFQRKKGFDFNDQYFLEICKNNDISIITHDRDFLEQSTDVITIITNLNT